LFIVVKRERSTFTKICHAGQRLYS